MRIMPRWSKRIENYTKIEQKDRELCQDGAKGLRIMPRSITMIGNRFKMGHNDKELSHMGYNYAKIEHNDWNIYIPRLDWKLCQDGAQGLRIILIWATLKM